MNERVRGVVLGLALGIGPLLLLNLATILLDAVGAGGEGASIWWPVACYLGAGALAAVGVGAGGHDRLVPAVAAAVVLLATLPTVQAGATGALPALPLMPDGPSAQAVALAVAGAYVYGAVRGPRG